MMHGQKTIKLHYASLLSHKIQDIRTAVRYSVHGARWEEEYIHVSDTDQTVSTLV
jgi:hypothetical protein